MGNKFDWRTKKRLNRETEGGERERFVGFVIALRLQTPKRIRGGWSHYTDTSEPVNGYGAQNMVTVQSRSRTSNLSITGPAR
jgi:hypothetical protein